MTSLFKIFKRPNKKSNKKSTKFIQEIQESLLKSNRKLTGDCANGKLHNKQIPELTCTVSDPPVNCKSQDSATNIIFQKYGYKAIQLLANSSEIMVCSLHQKTTNQQFVIKRIAKFNEILDVGCNGNRFFIETNPMKEALILNQCTVSTENKTYTKYIRQKVDFFRDETYHYLVMEDIGQISLKNWMVQAFEYISHRKLDIKHYRKIIKYIFWQISLVIYWLHTHHLICHLGIKAESFMVLNGEFVANDDGTISIPTNIQIKLCSFSTAQIFGSKYTETYKTASKTEIWHMGALLYLLTFGQCVSENIVECDQLERYIRAHDLTKYTTVQMFQLMKAMLCYDESKRFDALKVIQCEWFHSYWSKYKMKINKTCSQTD